MFRGYREVCIKCVIGRETTVRREHGEAKENTEVCDHEANA